MSAGIFFLVLGAALLHAVWNGLLKSGGDKTAGVIAVVAGEGVFGAVSLPFADAPPPAAWPFIAASVILHVGYQAFLAQAYRIGDLTQVYPIARGVAPMIVAGVSVGLLGVTLGRAEMLAAAVIAMGVMSMSLARQSDGLRNGRAAALALATGGFIAAYSLADGYGARAAGGAVGYFGWVAVGNAAAMLLWLPFRRGGARATLGMWRIGLIGGGASYFAYLTVIYAFVHAPIPLVTALRETSIVFALLIGVIGLGERLSLIKTASAMIALGGAVLLRLARG